MNKRIIRVIIYEGDEELVNIYEKHSLQHTQMSTGFPRVWGERNVHGEIFISGFTLKEETGLFQAIEHHNNQLKHRLFNLKEIELKIPSLEEPILNQLNK